MNLYQWMYSEYPEDFNSEDDARKTFKQLLCVFDEENPMHIGDCTSFPCACTMCIINGFIEEYMHYCIENRSKIF